MLHAANFKPNLNVNVTSNATTGLQIDTNQHLAGLSVGAAATAKMTVSGNKVLVTKGLDLNATAKLDLNDNDLILDYTGASQLATIQALINSARAGRKLERHSVITSMPPGVSRSTTPPWEQLRRANTSRSMATVPPFDGESIDTTAVLLKYTYYGDTDFNGFVDFDDYVRTDAGFNLGRSGWVNGDFDGNGMVEFDDYVLLDLGFNT